LPPRSPSRAGLVADAPGFLVNRLLMFYSIEAFWLLDEGHRIEDIDRAMTEWAMPIGPLALTDEVGIDVAAKVAHILGDAFAQRTQTPGWLDRLPEHERLGVKNGRVIYRYEGRERKNPDPEVYAILGLVPRISHPDLGEHRRRTVRALGRPAGDGAGRRVLRAVRGEGGVRRQGDPGVRQRDLAVDVTVSLSYTLVRKSLESKDAHGQDHQQGPDHHSQRGAPRAVTQDRASCIFPRSRGRRGRDASGDRGLDVSVCHRQAASPGSESSRHGPSHPQVGGPQVIALDTNVLVRFLVEDDPGQGRRAKALLQKAVDSSAPCLVSDVVLCELVWVLQTSYKLDRKEIGQVLERLLRAQHLTYSAADRLSRAAGAYGSGRGDYADYLIRELAREAGCEAVATFDRALLREPGFIAP
jgi:predicted nucleic-acid-binding protein